jgi:hypothetical protein
MPWTIYCHTHIDSGRRYVGLTKKTMLQRWNRHIYSSNHVKAGKLINGHFPNAIRKYGKDAFSHEVLEICDSLEAANAAEEKWVDFHDSRNPVKGFNLARGGEHIPHPIRKNPWSDLEFRKKSLIANKKLWKDPAFRAKNFAALQTTWNTPEYRAKRSAISKTLMSDPEIREKISAAQKGRKSSLTPEQLKEFSERGKRLVIPEVMRARALLMAPEVRERTRLNNLGRRWKQSPEVLKKIKNRNHERRMKRLNQPISHMCKKHGIIIGNDCFIGRRNGVGLRIECRKCMRERNRSYIMIVNPTQ